MLRNTAVAFPETFVVLDLSKPGRLPTGPWVNANNRYDGQLRFVTSEAQ